MDYKQKYKEALERAKSFRNHLLEIKENDYAFEVEYIFPELKESDDERIRKTLLKYVKDNGLPSDLDLLNSEVLTWLEKQGR